MFLLKKKNKVEKQEKEIDRVVGSINAKCAYGANMHELNEVERNIYLNEIFRKEIENGGFAMLFFHPAGTLVSEMMNSLTAIGAVKCAQLLQEGIAMFPKDITTLTNDERQDLLEEIDPDDKLFFELNEALSAMGEDILVYQTAYMLKHKQELK